ncbi:MAG: hypothetical protein HXY49_04560 [Ignavibacteriaceae bacterium]|nr:hypothetical protein [Ignavibacteriaceae bacterium]
MNSLKSIIELVKTKLSKDTVLEISWVFITQLTNVVLGFIIIKILSSMGSEDYGIYSLVLTVAALAGLFYGPLSQAFIKFYYHYLGQSLSGLFVLFNYRMLLLSFFSVLLISAAAMIFSWMFGFYSTPVFFLSAGLFIASLKLSEFFNYALNTIRKRKENSLLQAAEKILSIIVLYHLFSNSVLDVENSLLTLAMVYLFSFFLKITVFNKNIPVESQKDTSRLIEVRAKILKYMMPFILWSIAGWLQMNGERWIINGYLTTADVGIYAMMMSLVNAFVVIPNNVIVEFFTPIIFKQYSNISGIKNIVEGFIYIRLTVALIFIITVISTLIMFWFGGRLIILISDESYTVYSNLLPMLTLGSGLFLIGQAFALLGMGLNQPEKYISPKVSIGILSVILNLMLVYLIGVKGVAYTVLIVGIVYLVYIYLVNQRILNSFIKD